MKKPNKTEGIAARAKFLKEFPKHQYHIGDTCKAVDITRKTYYNWMEEPEFKRAIEEMQELLLDEAEKALMNLNREQNIHAVMFTLKTKGRKRGYQEQSKLDVTTNGEAINKISIEIIKPKEE